MSMHFGTPSSLKTIADAVPLYGLDFSSSPSRKQKKFLTLAECELAGDQLKVLGLSNWPGPGKGPFEEFELRLAKPGGRRHRLPIRDARRRRRILRVVEAGQLPELGNLHRSHPQSVTGRWRLAGWSSCGRRLARKTPSVSSWLATPTWIRLIFRRGSPQQTDEDQPAVQPAGRSHVLRGCEPASDG